jgi:putative CocE/NonD family hydrolase
MVVASALPYRVRVVENLWIPLAEGIRLAAKLWLPETTDRTPVPAVLEYIPYRKGDATAQRDAMLHPYFAGHGYAAIRVDMRGSGDSDGILTDEYLKLEQDDALEVISWIARQPWCTGAVGMIGNSWGGFNALQVAARRPPELKAIITSCSTDDRYADDIHYMGGCLLSDNLRWATIMLANNSRPPDPAVVGERWREMWLARLRDSGFWMKPWIEHQRRDAYWKHGSVCEDFAAIQCPVFALGGWSDGYSNAVPRLMAGLKVPRKAWIGQWSHNYPHLANPGPKAGFLQEAVRWWDKWLKGMDNGALDGPMLRVWMQDSVPPATRYTTLPGRWVAEPDWPPPGVRQRRYALNGNRLQAAAGDVVPLCIKSPQTVGWNGGRWYSQVIVPDLPGDQREDDGNSLNFDTDPLAERLEILGAPVVELELASDRAQGLVAVRLSNVASDGAATRVSYGLLNLSHREGHEHPKPLEPGRRYRVRIQLNDCAQSFPAGHRIRLAISTAYWPIAWPSPEPVTLTLFTGASTLELPERPPSPADAAFVQVPPVETPPPLEVATLQPGSTKVTVRRDLETGESVYEFSHDGGKLRFEQNGLVMASRTTGSYSIHPDEPLSAQAAFDWRIEFERGDWRVATRARGQMSATREDFHVKAELEAFEGDRRVFGNDWTLRVPRDGV